MSGRNSRNCLIIHNLVPSDAENVDIRPIPNAKQPALSSGPFWFQISRRLQAGWLEIVQLLIEVGLGFLARLEGPLAAETFWAFGFQLTFDDLEALIEDDVRREKRS